MGARFGQRIRGGWNREADAANFGISLLHKECLEIKCLERKWFFGGGRLHFATVIANNHHVAVKIPHGNNPIFRQLLRNGGAFFHSP